MAQNHITGWSKKSKNGLLIVNFIDMRNFNLKREKPCFLYWNTCSNFPRVDNDEYEHSSSFTDSFADTDLDEINDWYQMSMIIYLSALHSISFALIVVLGRNFEKWRAKIYLKKLFVGRQLPILDLHGEQNIKQIHSFRHLTVTRVTQKVFWLTSDQLRYAHVSTRKFEQLWK